jgi:4-carboxymuconolactone decarboxylase
MSQNQNFSIKSSRYNKGEELLKQNRPDEYENIINGLSQISPELGEFLLEFVYGSVWSRSYESNAVISPNLRAIVTITCLASLGKEPQLKSHIAGALKIGCSKSEIIECLLHLSIYAGFPVAINSLKVAQQVFDENL